MALPLFEPERRGSWSSSEVDYQRRHPEQTLLWKLVKEHWPAFLQAADEEGKRLPRYVLDEVDDYLRCGLLEYGFARLRCDGCEHDLLVAFSCKCRGICPSCGGRRMSNTAAHLADKVFPEVPVRQWVLSAPFELRMLLARRPEVVTAMDRIFVDEIGRFYRARADRAGILESRTGAVTFVQRFGGSLNLHVHLHVVVPDGVFTRFEEERSDFHGAPPPTTAELEGVVERVAKRMIGWLSRVGWLVENEDTERESDGLAGCQQMSLMGGTFAKLGRDGEGEETDDRRFGARARNPMSAEAKGFSLHAGVRIAASDADARERLFRYCARPTLSHERFSTLPDGRIAYALKKVGKGGSTHRVLEPLELMARLASLIPPPWHPLTRFHGVLAPNHSWRSSVVPEKVHDPAPTCPAPLRGQLPLALAIDPMVAEVTPPSSTKETSRIDWAKLLARTFNLDVLRCPCCGGSMRVAEVITERSRAAQWLAERGLSDDPPPRPRPRRPVPHEQLRLPFGPIPRPVAKRLT